MDPLSLRLANRAAGASDSAAGVEFGPGPCVLECIEAVTVAFGGATREGVDWWNPLHLSPGQTLELSPPRDGAWSYLALTGGVDAPMVMGSRSTNVREGIGNWLLAGDVIKPGNDSAAATSIEPPPMSGPIRTFGSMPGEWRVGNRVDRMGYELAGSSLKPGPPEELSEPLLPGFIQILPSGTPFVLMVEDPIVGGYEVAAAVHSDDLRLVAQTRPGRPLEFVGL
jgi:allophanate hydrolase subunit 2